MIQSGSTHFEKFRTSLEQDIDSLNPNDPSGKLAKEFGKDLSGVCINGWPKGKFRREQVFELAEEDPSNVNTATVCAAILAWGGMHDKHRKRLFELENKEWLEVACELRKGNLERTKAYDRFKKLRRHAKLRGMGPAFFTKLIYFLMPQKSARFKPGYIMDQWAGSSINLLTGEEIVLMDVQKPWDSNNGGSESKTKFTVSHENDGQNYEKFCEEVNWLAGHLGKCPSQIDRALVSKRRKTWREYVRERRLYEYTDQVSINRG